MPEEEIQTEETPLDLSVIESDVETLISQNNQIQESMEEYTTTIIARSEQINASVEKVTFTLSVIICFLVAASLVYAFKAFSRFLNNFF